MLARAATQQSQELERRVAALGALVLTIVPTVLLPTFELNTLVR